MLMIFIAALVWACTFRGVCLCIAIFGWLLCSLYSGYLDIGVCMCVERLGVWACCVWAGNKSYLYCQP